MASPSFPYVTGERVAASNSAATIFTEGKIIKVFGRKNEASVYEEL
jgi:DNA/RNA endonuclease YhcR with UshA esterase domain